VKLRGLLHPSTFCCSIFLSPTFCVLSFLARMLNVSTFQKMTEKDIDQSVVLLYRCALHILASVLNAG
jgi:hypothetical protein